MAKRSSSHPKIPSYSRGRVQKRAVTTTTDTYGLGMSVFNLLLSPPEPEQSWDVYDLGREVANTSKWPEWKPGIEFKAKRDAMLQ